MWSKSFEKESRCDSQSAGACGRSYSRQCQPSDRGRSMVSFVGLPGQTISARGPSGICALPVRCARRGPTFFESRTRSAPRLLTTEVQDCRTQCRKACTQQSPVKLTRAHLGIDEEDRRSYSARRAFTGLMDAALRAGMMLARSALTPSAAIDPASTRGSHPLT
jgi:hypothetical protein